MPHSYVLMTQALTVVGTRIQASFHNFSATCTVQLGLATYDSLGQGLNNQKLYDSQEIMLGPGHNATLAAALPPCYWQADTFYGPVLTPPFYGIQLFDFEFGGHACATATPTPASTAAATNTPTPTSTLGSGGSSTNTPTPTPSSTSGSSAATNTPTGTATIGLGGGNSTSTPTPTSTLGIGGGNATNTPTGTATIGIGGTGSGTNTPTATTTVAIGGVGSGTSTPTATTTVAIGGVGSGTSTPTAAAVSVSGSGGSTFDTFISPLTATIGTATFAESPTSAELPPGSSATIAGSISFTVSDLRGNNQGWVAYLSCTGASTGQPCLTSSLAPSGNGAQIMANQVAIAGLATVSLTPFFGQSFGPGIAINATGKTLDAMQAVAGECPVEGIGQGIYNVSVPLSATLTGLQTEYLTLPVSWTGNLDLTIIEGPASGGIPPAGC